MSAMRGEDWWVEICEITEIIWESLDWYVKLDQCLLDKPVYFQQYNPLSNHLKGSCLKMTAVTKSSGLIMAVDVGMGVDSGASTEIETGGAPVQLRGVDGGHSVTIWSFNPLN